MGVKYVLDLGIGSRGYTNISTGENGGGNGQKWTIGSFITHVSKGLHWKKAAYPGQPDNYLSMFDMMSDYVRGMISSPVGTQYVTRILWVFRFHEENE